MTQQRKFVIIVFVWYYARHLWQFEGKKLSLIINNNNNIENNIDSECITSFNFRNKASGSKTETAVSIVDTKGTEIIERPKYPTRPIDYYYKMNHKNRGIALIFNHETFHSFNMPIRKGTSVDRERLKQTFAGLGFDVRVYDNRTEAEIRTILENGKLQHKNE